MRYFIFLVSLGLCGAGCGPGQGTGGPIVAPPDASVLDIGYGFFDLNTPGNCGQHTFTLTRVPPNVMLVLDRSGSMKDSANGGPTSKWDDLKKAVGTLVQRYDGKVRFGATIFTAPGITEGAFANPPAWCDPGQIVVQLGDQAGQSVLTSLNSTHPFGNTPTAATLAAVRDSKVLGDSARSNYLVLVTDGQPTCPPPDNLSDYTDAKDGSVSAGIITQLYQASPSVKTYVVGMGVDPGTNQDDPLSNPTILNSWAEAGHTALAGSVEFHRTDSPESLLTAFDTVVNSIVSCSFSLSERPPDPSQLYVWADQTRIPADPNNGFRYDDSGPTIVLNGAACDSVRQNATMQVQVVYGCPAPPPIR